MVFIEAVAVECPAGGEESGKTDSFRVRPLQHAQYTRPAAGRDEGRAEILLSATARVIAGVRSNHCCGTLRKKVDLLDSCGTVGWERGALARSG